MCLCIADDYAKAGTDILGDSSQLCGFAPDDESWKTQRKKINHAELQVDSRKRVMKDLRIMKRDGEELGLEVEDCECLTDWVVKLVGAKGTVYEGETYRLRVRFHADYPSQPPEVTFMRPAPVHEHIYSDGKICLNILYNDWNPKMDVKSLCLSLLSMLSSAKKKSRKWLQPTMLPLHDMCYNITCPDPGLKRRICMLLLQAHQTMIPPSSCLRARKLATCSGSFMMTTVRTF